MNSRSSRYQKALDTSLRAGFRIEDVLPEGARFDPGRDMLPEALVQVHGLPLARGEQRILNHIRGRSYLCLFGLFEQFILPFVADHARTRFGEDDFEVRALLQFASEEAKHIHLFKRFAERFAQDFSYPCSLIGPASEIAAAVLSHHPIGIALSILQAEWMTQTHDLDAVKSGEALEPLFLSLLRHHWMEEAQHARIDGLIVEALAERSTVEEIERGVADYHRIVALLDAGLHAQVDLDLAALEQSIGRSLTDTQRGAIRGAQQQAYRYTFHTSGANHPEFLAAYSRLSARASASANYQVANSTALDPQWVAE